MEVLQELLTRLKTIPTTEFLAEIVQENRDTLEDLNAAQLDAGIDSEGDSIEPPYTAFTRQIKAAKGQPFDRVTLKDTGDFYRGIRVMIEPDGFRFGGGDWKTPQLKTKYGAAILGLTEENINEFNQYTVREEMTEKVRNYIIRI